MSVTEVIAQLRRAHALLTEARNATSQADKAITDGAATFATATTGSSQPEVEKIAHLAATASSQVQDARGDFAQVQAIIDAYCQHIAGHDLTDVTKPQGLSPATVENPPIEHDKTNSSDGPRAAPESYADLIAELQRNGAKISSDKVVRVGRHRDGRVIWLEEGDIDRSGRAHILRPARRKDFEAAGIPLDKVIDTIFHLVENHEPIDTDGRGGAIYEIDTAGGPKGLKVAIGDNGYIVTSHQVHKNRLRKRSKSSEGR
ncbi:hypothetical protein [Actinoalloteichus hymeniacidonis]|uniref:Uncharacterized protein n=1 Tax=Actinoalloteichus hymeniacidonis TaxID=340345 RepID=A0AAC9HMV7_9PSEU|nr:hypothetical protein [Actinoalloteichus hymeniacidonis]AOS62049.1 hypothetical protein TL08_06120 [Actinoalloteichus hymeniacidonis]MBB5909929.1 hypothetical protein [Actinoalloteichus hymeniacidonis]